MGTDGLSPSTRNDVSARLSEFAPHVYTLAMAAEVMVEHGATLWVGSDGPSTYRAGGFVAVARSRRGRSGAGDLVDAGRAGRPDDRQERSACGRTGCANGAARSGPGEPTRCGRGRTRGGPATGALRPWPVPERSWRSRRGRSGPCPASRPRSGGGRADDLALAAEHPAAAKGGFAWRRPRHSLKGRQDAQAVERSGLRLRLLRQQARAGDIRLLFGDESEALTLPYLAHAWAKRGADLRVEAPGQARRRALLGALDAATGRLIVATSASKRSADFIGLLERLDRELAPPAGAPAKPTVLVLDNGPIHTSRATAKALAARPWLTIEWLPKYAPELNDIERSWRDLKRHHLAHQTFASVDHLDTQIHHAVAAMNHERMPSPCPELQMARFAKLG